MHPHWYVSLSACAGHLRKSFGCSVCWLCARAPTHIDTPTCTQTLTDDRCCSCHPGPTPTHTLAHPSRGEHKPCPWKVIESCAWVETPEEHLGRSGAFFGSHCWQSHHVGGSAGGSVGDSVRNGTLGRAACTAAVLYILVISHATFPQRPEWHTRPGRLHCCRSVHLGDLSRDVSSASGMAHSAGPLALLPFCTSW